MPKKRNNTNRRKKIAVLVRLTERERETMRDGFESYCRLKGEYDEFEGKRRSQNDYIKDALIRRARRDRQRARREASVPND